MKFQVESPETTPDRLSFDFIAVSGVSSGSGWKRVPPTGGRLRVYDNNFKLGIQTFELATLGRLERTSNGFPVVGSLFSISDTLAVQENLTDSNEDESPFGDDEAEETLTEDTWEESSHPRRAEAKSGIQLANFVLIWNAVHLSPTMAGCVSSKRRTVAEQSNNNVGSYLDHLQCRSLQV